MSKNNALLTADLWIGTHKVKKGCPISQLQELIFAVNAIQLYPNSPTSRMHYNALLEKMKEHVDKSI